MAGEEERADTDVTKELITTSETNSQEKRLVYDDFVEGVATRDIAKREGVDASGIARIFQVVDKNGERSIHLVGHRDVVSGIGDTMERGGYRVREWHIKRPEDRALEVERITPDMERLLASAPVEAKKLISQSSVVGSELKGWLKELGEALEPFEPGNQTKKEGGE